MFLKLIHLSIYYFKALSAFLLKFQTCQFVESCFGFQLRSCTWICDKLATSSSSSVAVWKWWTRHARWEITISPSPKGYTDWPGVYSRRDEMISQDSGDPVLSSIVSRLPCLWSRKELIYETVSKVTVSKNLIKFWSNLLVYVRILTMSDQQVSNLRLFLKANWSGTVSLFCDSSIDSTDLIQEP